MGLFLASILLHRIESCLGYCSFKASLEVSVSSPYLFFFDKIVLAILGPLYFLMNFRIGLSISPNQTC